MVATNLGAAAVVAAVALIVVVAGHLPPVVAFVAIFKLNGLTTFMQPARASVMPSVVGNDLLRRRRASSPRRGRRRWWAARRQAC